MPRQRIHHGRTVYVLPDDFPQRIKRLRQESGLPLAEIARRIDTTPYTVWRWVEVGVRAPLAAPDCAAGLGRGPGPRPPARRVNSAGGRAGGDGH